MSVLGKEAVTITAGIQDRRAICLLEVISRSLPFPLSWQRLTFVPSSPVYPTSPLNRGREESSGLTHGNFPSRDSDLVVSAYSKDIARFEHQVAKPALFFAGRRSMFWCNFVLFYCFISQN